jgi:hypothetical protein
MSTEITYRVRAPFTCMELVSIRCAVKNDINRFWKWRHDPTWRQHLRDYVSAYRKLQRQEVA